MNKSDIALELATLLYEHGFIVNSKNAKHHEADLQDVAALLRPHVWEWIPVGQEMPEYGSCVLVYGYDDPEKISYINIATISYMYGWNVGVKDGDYVVTHWAALPSAPLSLESSDQK